MDRFIVGTGRCGSTLLSRMLAESPAVLSVFEFFNGLDAARRFDPAAIDGREFAELISAEQPFVTAVLRRGYAVSEITYPFGGGSRFRRDDPLPWILVSMLPRLTDDPDRLFDDVMQFCSARPAAKAVGHCRALFDHLCSVLGRECWIERSGSSIDYLDDLADSFPDARFLHIHRDGPEAALSMREHHAYRLPIALMYRPSGAGDPVALAAALRSPPGADDPISRVLASRPPVEYYGRYWSDQITRGDRARSRLPPDRYLEVRFEELVATPQAVLRRIADFFALDASREAWVERASGLVRGVPPTRFERLPAEEQVLLRDACRPGRERLGQRA